MCVFKGVFPSAGHSASEVSCGVRLVCTCYFQLCLPRTKSSHPTTLVGFNKFKGLGFRALEVYGLGFVSIQEAFL